MAGKCFEEQDGKLPCKIKQLAANTQESLPVPASCQYSHAMHADPKA